MTTHFELTPSEALGNITPVSVSKYSLLVCNIRQWGELLDRGALWKLCCSDIHQDLYAWWVTFFTKRQMCEACEKKKDASECLSTFKSSSVPAQQSK